MLPVEDAGSAASRARLVAEAELCVLAEARRLEVLSPDEYVLRRFQVDQRHFEEHHALPPHLEGRAFLLTCLVVLTGLSQYCFFVVAVAAAVFGDGTLLLVAGTVSAVMAVVSRHLDRRLSRYDPLPFEPATP